MYGRQGFAAQLGDMVLEAGLWEGLGTVEDRNWLYLSLMACRRIRAGCFLLSWWK